MAKEEAGAQLVFVPIPGISHLMSTVEFAKLLVNHDHRLSVSLMVMKSPFDTKIEEYTKSLAYQRIKVIILPDCPTPSVSTSDRGSFMTNLINSYKPHLRDAVSQLTTSQSSPPLAAFVIDMFCTSFIDIAREFNVPALVFYTSGASFLGLMLHLHTLRERDNLDFIGLDTTDTEFAIPSFANPVPARVLPSIVLRKEWEALFLSYVTGLKQADGIIVNSFEELESHAVQSLSHGEGAPPIYPVGPILQGGDVDRARLEETESIIKWLDDQPHSSVLFLCFGSTGSFREDQNKEIARALEDSGTRFLWSMRKPPPKGVVGFPSDYSPAELAQSLPQGFLDRTSTIGRVIGWAPQTRILAHPATAGFVSHCGWNSTLESIYYGVPVATWPLGAEQQTNAFLLVRELEMAVAISLDYRVESGGEANMLLSADQIARGIRDLFDDDAAAAEIRKRVKDMSLKSNNTAKQGGCSYSHLERLIDYIMDHL